MSFRKKLNTFFGLIAGLLLAVFGKSPAKPTGKDFRDADFRTSTQHLGLRFTERIRNIFRLRWIRKS
ncbi:MAG: hypothetical protein JXB29_04810 [Sedimentisphaerales bacterium]|nr:hypothetical protein [Sedimentisphaerales bacterium]